MTCYSLYCVILLTTLAHASCYWNPVPAGELWQSIVTHHPASASFSSSNSSSIPLLSALNSTSVSPVQTTTIPDPPTITEDVSIPADAKIPLLERCWCDFTLGLLGSGSTGFFSPFDVTAWEMGSYARERRRRARKAQREADLARMKAEKEVADSVEVLASEEGDDGALDAEAEAGTQEREEDALKSKETSSARQSPPPGSLSSIFKRAGSLWVDFTLSIIPVRYHIPPSPARKPSTDRITSTPAPHPSESPSPQTGSEPYASTTGESDAELRPKPVPAALPPWTLDLRPHGMGLVIDFNWGRPHKY